MIERQSGAKTLLCDDCGDHFERSFPDGQFDALLAAIKLAGWRVSPDGAGGWMHQCPDCRPGKKGALAAQRKLLGL